MSLTSKEIILQKIKHALATPVAAPFNPAELTNDYYTENNELSIEELFVKTFTNLSGIFSYAQNMAELKEQLNALFTARQIANVYCVDEPLINNFKANNFNLNLYEDLATSHASITLTDALVARTGSMVLTSANPGGRIASVYAPIHICIAYTSQIVYDIKDALALLHIKYNGNLPSQISFASGPSRTADIEKTLVTGVHGPKEVYCFLLEG
jgi:L-lactate dehydrogenase complex protein LldG